MRCVYNFVTLNVIKAHSLPRVFAPALPIIAPLPGRCVWPLLPQQPLLARRLENLEGAHQVLVDGHHRAAVVELAAVVGRGEDRHQLTLREELVPILHNLSVPTNSNPFCNNDTQWHT